MKVACIYFPISSVGGISTVAKNLKAAALAAGDTFDVLRSSHAKTIQPGKFASPKRIRGGDTHIEIDGEAPHGTGVFPATKKWLEANYDALFFVHPCCHPTKEYGDVPFWLDMYTKIALPKSMHVADGYAETYPWVREAIKHCTDIWVNQAAYALPLVKLGIASTVLPHPFWPFPDKEKRSPKRLTLFPNQWKNIKCPHEFVAAMPRMTGQIDLFSNGIEYYNIRGSEDWGRAIGVDLFAKAGVDYVTHFKGPALRGPKTRTFHGNIPLADIARWYQKAWSIVDLMGQRAKYGAYKEGSFNYTALEALWYGARPILHDQARKAKLPQELLVTINLGPKHADLLPLIKAVNTVQPLSPKEKKTAREFINDRHHAGGLWAAVKKGLKSRRSK